VKIPTVQAVFKEVKSIVWRFFIGMVIGMFIAYGLDVFAPELLEAITNPIPQKWPRPVLLEKCKGPEVTKDCSKVPGFI
jgi:D-alanyl-lipoteichoic acid acyltransferase DltB (MBOAT superfamily)